MDTKVKETAKSEMEDSLEALKKNFAALTAEYW